ncbi:MAG: rRNA maturation RNase YbeY [Trueperaceae bacterium]
MRVEILDRTNRFRRRRRLAELARRLGASWGVADREVTIVLVDDATIAAMNLRDRAVEGPTDVLSYPLHEPDDAGFPTLPHLGDVIVSLDTARLQARTRGALLWHEVAELVAHGLLHLMGHDHQTEDGWAPFHAGQAQARELALVLDREAAGGVA